MNKEEKTLFKKSFKTPLDRSKMIPSPRNWFLAISKLSRKKKTYLAVFFVIFVVSTYSLLTTASDRYFTDVPAYGGTFTEGIVGTPRYINPLLATSDTDKDLTSLIFDGLLKASRDGEYVPNLASKYEVSEDGLIYTITLKNDLTWHDGKPITSKDVVFTIDMVRNEFLKSPERANWLGVEVEAKDEKTVTFTLSSQYYPFLENLTLGIIPEHLWSDTKPEQIAFNPLNLDPVGSGLYKVTKTKRDSNGAITEISLESFKKHHTKKAYISKINFMFFATEDDALAKYLNDKLDSIGGLSPQTASWLAHQKGTPPIVEGSLPRVFAIFFNQNQAPIFLNQEVRNALEVAIDKEAIINSVLLGYGEKIDSPLAPPYNVIQERTDTGTSTRISTAKSILEKAGWKQGEDGIYQKTINKTVTPLSFSISTLNNGDLKVAAEEVVKTWTELGAKVEIKKFERGDLNQDVIRPRKYDTLLFGQVTGRYPDPFAFWHSSQRLDPGLNVALYTNSKVDDILEDIRTTRDSEERLELYKDFSEMIISEKPAIFLYSPNYIYLTPSKVSGILIDTRSGSSGRFSNIEDWYIFSHKTWIH